MSEATPMADEAVNMLTALFNSAAEGELIDLRLIRSDHSVKEEFLPVTELDEVVEWALRHRGRGNVYVGVLPRTEPDGRRAAVGTAAVTWVDCDSPKSVAALEQFPLKPSMTVRSGSGGNVHAYWFLTEPLELDQLERINKRLAATLGGDLRVHDAARVLRVPGTLNHKHEPPTEVRLVSCSAMRCSAQAMEKELEQLEPSDEVSAPSRRAPAVVSPSPVTERVLALLEGVAETGNGWKACCPVHDDESPSLSIAAGDDGRCLLHCFAGCDYSAIVQALGLQIGDLFPPESGGHKRENSAATKLVEAVLESGAELFRDSNRDVVRPPAGP